MKQLMKMISVFMLVMICLSVPSYANATLDWSTIQQEANDFLSKGEAGKNLIKTENTANLVEGLASILTTIGVTIVLAGLLIMGIKYMTATPEEAAKLKTKLVGLAVAGIVIMGAYGIWKLVGTFLFNMTSMTN